jgi:hypothetical protein
MLTVLLTTVHVSPTQASPTPVMYVEPSSTTVNFGENFPINVSVTNVNDLYLWGFKIFYLKNILIGLTATEGPFLKSGGNSTAFFIVDFINDYNETHGLIRLTCTLLGNVSGVNGSGTLATITFNALGVGNTSLSLPYTVLADSQINPITYTTEDGNVDVVGIADIALTNVNPLKTVVGQGHPVGINVTVENQGELTETFNLTLYAQTTPPPTEIKTVLVSNLLANETRTITIIWNTSGWSRKTNYTISAYAWAVLGEGDLADNNRTDGSVRITIFCDVNGDSSVDMADISIMIDNFMNTPPKWDPNSDVNDDLTIDMADVSVAIDHFMESDS